MNSEIDPESLFHDPAYRMMVDEIGDKELAFIRYLMDRDEPGDLETAREMTDRWEAALKATPDGWMWCQLEELGVLERQGEMEEFVERVENLQGEYESRVAQWIGRDE